VEELRSPRLLFYPFFEIRNVQGCACLCEATPSPERASLKERALEELKAFLYISLYFWVLCLTFELTQTMTLRSAGMTAVSSGFAIVNALVLAKVALLMETFYMRRRTWNTRLAYQVLAHSFILAVILITFSLIEEGIKALLHGEGFGAHYDAAHITFIAAKGAVFFVSLIPFCAFQELARLLGAHELSDLFFKPQSESSYTLVRESDRRDETPTDR